VESHLLQRTQKMGHPARPEEYRWSSLRHYASGETGVVEIESQWTARRRERLGIFLTLKMRESAEKPRSSDAETVHPQGWLATGHAAPQSTTPM
jgi:hypothetical protein